MAVPASDTGAPQRGARTDRFRPPADATPAAQTPRPAAERKPSNAAPVQAAPASPPAATTDAAAPTRSRWYSPAEEIRRRHPQLHGKARLPVVFEIPPEEVSGLNPRQVAAAIAIAEQFQQTMGGEAADPSTEEYLEKWRREQPLVDYQLRAAIGAQAYARWQEEAYFRARATAP